jgi:hypothetical protein
MIKRALNWLYHLLFDKSDRKRDDDLWNLVSERQITGLEPKKDQNTITIAGIDSGPAFEDSTMPIPTVLDAVEPDVIEQELDSTAETVKSNLDRLKQSKQASKTVKSGKTVDPEPESTPEQVKHVQEGLSAAVKQLKQPGTTVNAADTDLSSAEVWSHVRLCAEIDQMLVTWPDYDGSHGPNGDYPIIYDGYQPIQRLQEPKSA